MAKIKNVESLCERELLEKILHTVEEQEKALAQHQMPQNHLYDNKALMAKLGIKEKYLKKLRDNGYLGYSRQGDKYWYTQEDHYDAFAASDELPQRRGGGYGR